MFDPYGHSSRPIAAGHGSDSAHDRGSPATAETRPWHRRPAWTRFARQLLRYYSRRGDFHLAIKPNQTDPLACVNPARRRVEVTTAFPKAAPNGPLSSGGVRGASRLRTRPADTWLRGFVAHEAGHIRYSNAKPTKRMLGWLWNALEDERMERLMAADHDELSGIFTTIGDVMLSSTDEEWQKSRARRQAADERATSGVSPDPADVLNACLQWRWLHDHDAQIQDERLPLPESEFNKIRGLVEEAWVAPDSDEVTRLASEILSVFDMSEDAQIPGEVPVFDLPRGAYPDGRPIGSACDSTNDATGSEDDVRDGIAGGIPEDEANGDGAPEAPGLDPESDAQQAGADLLAGQDAAVQALARALRPEAPRSTLRTPYSSRGRFEYHRYVAGRSRIFTRRPERPHPPAAITALLDASGSMVTGGLFVSAQRCIALISGAAEVAGTTLRLIPFTDQPWRTLASPEIGHEALRSHLASYRACGRTTLSPALRQAFQLGARSTEPHCGERHIVVLVSDGQLEEPDSARCRLTFERALASQPGLIVLPLLLGAALAREESGAVDGAAVYDRIFGRHAAVENPADLAEVTSRWLQHAA